MKIQEALKKTGKAKRDHWGEEEYIHKMGMSFLDNKGNPFNREDIVEDVWQPYIKEDDIGHDVERIVLEEVVWQKHEDRHWTIVYPQTCMTVEEEQRFIDGPPMKMILEIPKEAP